MKREFEIRGIHFEIGNYTPRKNEYEKGCKYQLYANGYPTGYIFETLHYAKDFAKKNYSMWMY